MQKNSLDWWNAIQRCAEQLVRRDHGLALALATLFRYAGPRVSEVVALQIPDVQVSAWRGLLIIRRGKGLKHREIPLVQEAREPLAAYFNWWAHLNRSKRKLCHTYLLCGYEAPFLTQCLICTSMISGIVRQRYC